MLRGLGDEDWPRVRQVVAEAHDGADDADRAPDGDGAAEATADGNSGGGGRLAAVRALLVARGFDVHCVPSRHAPASDFVLYARRRSAAEASSCDGGAVAMPHARSA